MRISLLHRKFFLTIAISLISLNVTAQSNDAVKNETVSAQNQATPEMQEKEFKQKMMIDEKQIIVYKKLVTEAEFESTKNLKPSFQYSARAVGDVLVVQELSEEEIAFREIKEFNLAKHDALIREFKSDPSKTLAYKIITPLKGLLQAQANDKKANIAKYMMSNDDEKFLVMLVQQSEEESKAAGKLRRAPSLKVKVGDLFPAFSLPATKTKTVDSSLFKGKLTLINFFFDKCAPCIKETPELNAFSKSHPNVQVLAMTSDSLKLATKYTEEHQFEWNIASANAKFMNEALGISTFPSFALVDADGKILGISSGSEIPVHEGIVERGLVEWITKLTDGKSL